MPEINVALIGHRFMGKAHSNAYRQVRKFFPGNLVPRMKVLCGKACTEELEETARQFGWEESDCEWERVIERKDIDMVDISTPGFLHHPMVIAAAQAGKHVFCEKPLANTLSEAKEMLKAVEKAGVMHMVNFNYRRVPAVAFAKKLIDEGRIGEPICKTGLSVLISLWFGGWKRNMPAVARWAISPHTPRIWLNF
jgi:predicted dehydrogenase